MKQATPSLTGRIAALSLLALGACGGFGTDANIGGTLAGLGTGLTVVLSNNGTDNLSLTANGSFVFPKQVASGGAYSVAVVTQPLAQTCTVGNATGNVNAAGSDIDKITVTCAVTSSITVAVTGLASGVSVTLSNGPNALSFANDGSQAFPGLLAPGTQYAVTITTNPTKCKLPDNATGTVPATGFVGLIVTCT